LICYLYKHKFASTLSSQVGVDHMPSGNTDLVLLDMAAQQIDPSCLESHSSKPTGSNKVNSVLVC